MSDQLPDLSKVPPEERDRVWYETYYQGDNVPQLTLRAVLMGGFIGMAMSISNLYTTLKLGWAFGVAITACVLSYAIWNTVVGIGLSKSKMTLLENNCMQSTASAAGYSTGGTIATAAGALLLITGDAERMGWLPLAVWVFCVAVLGVFLAIPMKRQMINQEQLPFPSGIAAAETLRSLYAKGDEAQKKARDLIDAMIAGGMTGMGLSFGLIPASLEFGGAMNSKRSPLPFSALGVAYEPSLLMLAAGAITGLRVCASMMLGACINWFVLAPLVIALPAQVPNADGSLPDPAYDADGNWVDMKDRARPDTLFIHLDHFGTRAEDGTPYLPPTVSLTAAGGTPVSSALRDDGKLGDAKAGDGTWSLLLDVPAAAYAVHLSAGGRELDASAADWEEGNLRRDLGLSVHHLGWMVQDELVDAWALATVSGEAGLSGKTFAGDLEVRRNAETGEYTSIGIRKWSLWFGTALLVSAGLTAFAMNWRQILRALMAGRKGKAAGSGAEAEFAARMAAIEVPASWMFIGVIPTTVLLAAVCYMAMGIAPWLSVVSVVLSGVLALVACRATGETDTTPVGAMGKITQFAFALLSPADKTVNLMTAGVTAGAAGSSADLLTDLKSGYLLGANPRQQFIAQLSGVFFGLAAVIPAWYLMVPTADTPLLQNSPPTAMWYAVAQALSDGVASIPLTARYGIAAGALIGVLLPILEVSFPKARSFIPSSMGLGLAFVITFPNALAFFIGALIAERWVRRDPGAYEKKIIPLASGAIAGESLVSAGYAMLNSLRVLAT
jgi:uncharacterized oligopeptide transporter (OPT) family protein